MNNAQEEMNVAHTEIEQWREVVRLAYQNAGTAADLIARGEVQRGAGRAHAATETLRHLKARMDRVGKAGDSSPG